MDNPQVLITPEAGTYLGSLLAKHQTPGTGVRIYINNPGSYTAETCLAYCLPGDERQDDVLMTETPFKVWLDKRSVPYLSDAEVGFDADQFGGQLTIKAPNAKIVTVSDNSPMIEQVNYVLQNDINPQLASHGGMVSVVEVVENDTVAVLQFGGGCQGCGMVDVTLKQGVEKTLLESVKGLKGVRDITDHSDSSQAYYP